MSFLQGSLFETKGEMAFAENFALLGAWATRQEERPTLRLTFKIDIFHLNSVYKTSRRHSEVAGFAAED